MKKLLTLALAGFAAMLFAVSCNNDENTEPLDVNEGNLAGTWEQTIEHDYAQGYMQKYRVKFEGKNYTMWHMYQEIETIDGKYGGLVCVGDKYTGTWEYSGGKLVFTHKTWSASSFINSINPLSYTYYDYNVDTMESNPWYESQFADTLDPLEWPVISLTYATLTVRINMDTFALAKK